MPPGWYYLVIWAGDRQIWEPATGAFAVHPGSTVTRNLRVAPYPLAVDDIGFPVSGLVEDAITGEPLAGAFVSVGLTDPASVFSGIGSSWEATTDARGAFVLHHVPAVRNERSVPIGVYPVIAASSGHQPGGTGSAAREEWIPLPEAGDTIRVVIRLLPGGGTASVRGRVVHDGRPVVGVPVVLTVADTAVAAPVLVTQALPSRAVAPQALAPGLVAVSDANGYFEIGHVAPARYYYQVAYLPDDGWAFIPPEWPDEPEPFIVRDADVDLGDQVVLAGIAVVSPPPGGAVNTGHPWLKWRRVTGADMYYVAYSRANRFWLTEGLAISDTTVQIPAGVWGNGDHARWAVYAYRGATLIGSTETVSVFEIRSY